MAECFLLWGIEHSPSVQKNISTEGCIIRFCESAILFNYIFKDGTVKLTKINRTSPEQKKNNNTKMSLFSVFGKETLNCWKYRVQLPSMCCPTTQVFLCSHITGLLHDFLSREEDGMSSQFQSEARDQKIYKYISPGIYKRLSQFSNSSCVWKERYLTRRRLSWWYWWAYGWWRSS